MVNIASRLSRLEDALEPAIPHDFDFSQMSDADLEKLARGSGRDLSQVSDADLEKLVRILCEGSQASDSDLAELHRILGDDQRRR
jgi:hypothetical protein